MNENDVEMLPTEMSGGGYEMLQQGAALVKLENTTQMMVAVQRPRDEAVILAASLRELETYPSLAEEALYAKPVGKDPDTGKTKIAEGLSIRAAESLSNRWTNSAYACEVVEETEEHIKICAVHLDYESNTRRVLPGRVSKYFKSRKGQVLKYAPDRLDVVVAAYRSRLLREVILRSLPAGLKIEYEKKIRDILAGTEKLEKRKKVMLAKFKELGIAPEQVASLREKLLEEFTHEDLTSLTGVYNALRDGELTKAGLFGVGGDLPSAEPQTKTSTVKPAPQAVGDVEGKAGEIFGK